MSMHVYDTTVLCNYSRDKWTLTTPSRGACGGPQGRAGQGETRFGYLLLYKVSKKPGLVMEVPNLTVHPLDVT